MTDSIGPFSRLVRSPGFKFFLISFLILMLLIPLVMVMALVSEREMRAASVRAEVAGTWGGPQQLFGPFLVVPYSVRVETVQGEKRIERVEERRAVFLPEDLEIRGGTQSQLLHRSIFDVSVYTADMAIVGSFKAPDIKDVDPNAIGVRWQGATLVVGLSDVSGLKEQAKLEVGGGEALPFEPSLNLPGTSQNGIHVRLAGSPSILPAPDGPVAPFSFRIGLKFSGSSSLSFAPAGRETRVALASDWPHPSFFGGFLPADRTLRADGFSATWRVPHLARSVPHAWSLSDAAVDRFQSYQMGVSYYQPLEFYDLVSRATKYGILFLGLAFMGVFVMELASPKRVHPVQYLFTGIAMVFFCVLLLSISEHAGFATAYIIAAGATGTMLATYVGKVLESARTGFVMLALFLALYGFLYLVLQLEDYALIAGAILGFVSLTAVMFATLKVDWSDAARRTAG